MKGSFFQERSDMQEQQLLAGEIPSLANWCAAPSEPDGLLHTEMDGHMVRRQKTSSPGNYMGLFEDLHKSLTGKGPNPVPPEDGIKTIRIIEAALTSAEEGRQIVF